MAARPAVQRVWLAEAPAIADLTSAANFHGPIVIQVPPGKAVRILARRERDEHSALDLWICRDADWRFGYRFHPRLGEFGAVDPARPADFGPSASGFRLALPGHWIWNGDAFEFERVDRRHFRHSAMAELLYFTHEAEAPHVNSRVRIVFHDQGDETEDPEELLWS